MNDKKDSGYSLADIPPLALFVPLGTTDMKKLDLSDFVAFGRATGRLRTLKKGKPSSDEWNAILRAYEFLELICDDRFRPEIPLNVCIPSAKRVHKLLKHWSDELFETVENYEIKNFEIEQINGFLTDFETVFPCT